jgi:hypothetical protein
MGITDCSVRCVLEWKNAVTIELADCQVYKAV